ncbi:hypothetical protein CG709_07590, partial [Lachnotalea glycerini]
MKRVWKKIKVTLFSVVLMVAFTAGCSSTKSTSDDFTQAEQETKEESSQEAVKTENTKDESELLH